MEYDKETLEKMLAEAEADKIALDGHILYLKRKLGLSTEAAVAGSPGGAPPPPQGAAIQHDSFFGMPIADAVRKYLQMAKAPKTTHEIVDALEKGGFVHSSKNFYSSVASIMSRKKDILANVKGKWGLIEWYPGMKRPKANAGQNGKEEVAES